MASQKQPKKQGAGPLTILGAVAAGAAMSYFFLGTQAKKRRTELKTWTLKARADVLEKIDGMREVSKDTYEEAVDQVVDKYGKAKKTTTSELDELRTELKRHWSKIKKDVVDAPASSTKKVAKKAAARTKKTLR